MKFFECPLKGAFVIELEKHQDERGFFARAFCKNEFEKIGLENEIVQINNSFNIHEGTLRGIHYQLEPKSEDKIIRCLKGSLYDVIIDLRKNSKTFGNWFGIELTAENRKILFVPKGFAHGYQTLENETEALYLVTEFYTPQLERGIRWNDPKFNIKWPAEPTFISEKDKSYPAFDPKTYFI